MEKFDNLVRAASIALEKVRQRQIEEEPDAKRHRCDPSVPRDAISISSQEKPNVAIIRLTQKEIALVHKYFSEEMDRANKDGNYLAFNMLGKILLLIVCPESIDLVRECIGGIEMISITDPVFSLDAFIARHANYFRCHLYSPFSQEWSVKCNCVTHDERLPDCVPLDKLLVRWIDFACVSLYKSKKHTKVSEKHEKAEKKFFRGLSVQDKKKLVAAFNAAMEQTVSSIVEKGIKICVLHVAPGQYSDFHKVHGERVIAIPEFEYTKGEVARPSIIQQDPAVLYKLCLSSKTIRQGFGAAMMVNGAPLHAVIDKYMFDLRSASSKIGVENPTIGLFFSFYGSILLLAGNVRALNLINELLGPNLEIGDIEFDHDWCREKFNPCVFFRPKPCQNHTFWSFSTCYARIVPEDPQTVKKCVAAILTKHPRPHTYIQSDSRFEHQFLWFICFVLDVVLLLQIHHGEEKRINALSVDVKLKMRKAFDIALMHALTLAKNKAETTCWTFV
jgi:hypothetical protein